MRFPDHRALIVLVVATSLGLLGSVTLGADDATVRIDGKPIELDGAVLRLGDQYVLLPAESYLEALGARVTWDPDEGRLTASKDDTLLVMVVGQNYAIVNLAHVPLAMAAQTLSGKPYVPVGPCAEAFGMELRWDPDKLQVSLTTKVQPPQGKIVKGTLLNLAVHAAATNLLVRVTEDGNLETYEASPNAAITRGLAGLELQRVNPTALKLGDLLELSLDQNDRVVAVKATYLEVKGTIDAIASNYLLLKEGSFHPIAQKVEVVTEQGQPITLSALPQGTKVTLRVSPANNEVWTITAHQAGGAPALPVEQAGPPQILAFTTPGYTKPLKVGEELQIKIEGTPGCQATAALGEGGRTIELPETQPGVYLANLQVEPGMDILSVKLAGWLVRGDEQSEVAYTDSAVTIDTLMPQFANVAPARDATLANAAPSISVKYSDRGGAGLDLETVRMFLDDLEVTDQAEVRADQVVLATEDLTDGEHTVRVALADQAGNANSVAWQFAIALVAGGQIRSVQHDATGALTAGDTLIVTMTAAAPGGQATFDIAGLTTGIPMNLLPGGATYVGSYTVKPNDRVTDAIVTAHFVAADGTEHTLPATNPVTITPQLPTKLEIRSPNAGETTERHARLSGVAPPGMRVRFIVSYQKVVFGGQLCSGVLNVDEDGNWESEPLDLKIPLLKMADKYVLRCELLDADDNVVEQEQVEFFARE